MLLTHTLGTRLPADLLRLRMDRRCRVSVGQKVVGARRLDGERVVAVGDDATEGGPGLVPSGRGAADALQTAAGHRP